MDLLTPNDWYPHPLNMSQLQQPDGPRCRRCRALLNVRHLVCDDGAIVTFVTCPLCNQPPRTQPRVTPPLGQWREGGVDETHVAADPARPAGRSQAIGSGGLFAD